MLLIDVFKAFLVGICASAPIGPIAIFVIQKTLSQGRRAGFVTSLGSTVVDTLFAVIAIFALAIAEKFLREYETAVLIGGGLIVGALGLSMALRDPFRKLTPEMDSSYSVGDFVRALVMGLSNPGAILVIFALFAFFGISVEHNDFAVAPVILAVALGSLTYWFLLTWGLSHLRNKLKLSTLLAISRVSGIIVLLIGIALLAEGLIKVIFT